MRAFEFGRCALSISLATALLSACGESSMPIRAGNSTNDGGSRLKNNKAFEYTGKKQTFIVPAGVTRLTVSAHGGEGAGNPTCNYSLPGLPGRVYAVVRVHPGDKLYVFVGGSGKDGGFNGGSAGGAGGYGKFYTGNTGGGASDVRVGGDTLPDRVIVAAGGGGAGAAVYTYGNDYGGKGGGLAGQSGGGAGSYETGGGGAGGTQSEGGSGGSGGGYTYRGSYKGEPGGNGALSLGGNGGNSVPFRYAGGGGGGGGGYYGGGGGGGGGIVYYDSRYETSEGGGGGGGSSYVEPSAIKSRMWSGWKNAESDGLVVFSWN